VELGGEHLDTLERLIVSPVAGIFSSLPERPTTVDVGATLGFVRTASGHVPVRSPFAGVVVGIDAVDGERLEPYQRVAWLRAA
jgi:hypothetical protein